MSFGGAAVHIFVKALNESGVKFPATKEEIKSKLKDIEVQISDSEFVSAADVVDKLGPDSFENGTAFMCAYISSTSQPAKQAFLNR